MQWLQILAGIVVGAVLATIWWIVWAIWACSPKRDWSKGFKFVVMLGEVAFWWWRVRVSLHGWYYFRRFGWYGFQSDEFDRDAYDGGDSPRDYFIEAWCRE